MIGRLTISFFIDWRVTRIVLVREYLVVLAGCFLHFSVVRLCYRNKIEGRGVCYLSAPAGLIHSTICWPVFAMTTAVRAIREHSEY